jgi:hypothetical protein
MITKKRVLVAAIALDGLILVAVLVLHIAGWYQPNFSVGGVSVPIHHTADSPEYIDENTFFYTTSPQPPLDDIAAFYSERLAAIGWLAQPGEHYQDTSQEWVTQRDEDPRMVYKQLIVFAKPSIHPQRYLLVAIGIHLSPVLCGDSYPTVIIRTTNAPTASARAAEGFALFGQLPPSRADKIILAARMSCAG